MSWRRFRVVGPVLRCLNFICESNPPPLACAAARSLPPGRRPRPGRPGTHAAAPVRRCFRSYQVPRADTASPTRHRLTVDSSSATQPTPGDFRGPPYDRPATTIMDIAGLALRVATVGGGVCRRARRGPSTPGRSVASMPQRFASPVLHPTHPHPTLGYSQNSAPFNQLSRCPN